MLVLERAYEHNKLLFEPSGAFGRQEKYCSLKSKLPKSACLYHLRAILCDFVSHSPYQTISHFSSSTNK